MNPTDAAWWWEYALDGVVGGVLGGVVTAGAVIATLQHERKMADLQDARAAASHLQALTWNAHPGPTEDLMHRAMVELSARVHRRWRRLSDELLQLMSSDSPTKDVALQTQGLVLTWMGAPHTYELTRRREAIRWLRRTRKAVTTRLGVTRK